MRPILPGDVTAAARALLHVPPGFRDALMKRIITEAEAADCYRRKFRKAHAVWGNGTLMAAALARPVAREPRSNDRDYLDCQARVIDALIQRADQKPRTRHVLGLAI
jgi:hypothetical protein